MRLDLWRLDVASDQFRSPTAGWHGTKLQLITARLADFMDEFAAIRAAGRTPDAAAVILHSRLNVSEVLCEVPFEPPAPLPKRPSKYDLPILVWPRTYGGKVIRTGVAVEMRIVDHLGHEVLVTTPDPHDAAKVFAFKFHIDPPKKLVKGDFVDVDEPVFDPLPPTPADLKARFAGAAIEYLTAPGGAVLECDGDPVRIPFGIVASEQMRVVGNNVEFFVGGLSWSGSAGNIPPHAIGGAQVRFADGTVRPLRCKPSPEFLDRGIGEVSFESL